jgi:ATP-dependent DNA helicase RecQ
MQLSFSDIFLGYFENRQYQINRLMPGDNLIIGNDGCTNQNGDIVLRFSKKFNDTISSLQEQGYHLKNVKINFIIYWIDPEKENEYKIILPELNFERMIT